MIKNFSEILDRKNQSEFIKDYIDLKKQHPNSILFFQLGSFFETFFEDAKLLSEIFGVALGSRKVVGDEILQAGVSLSAIKTYVKELLNRGYKVCVCSEQKDETGRIERKLSRIYTQGTVVESEFLDTFENNFLMAIYKNKNDYFLSYADVSTGQFYKTVCDYETIRHEVYKILPNELLICENQKDIFQDFIKKFNVNFLDERYFSKNIEKTILKYCAQMQMDYMVEFDDIISYIPQQYMFMDEITRRNLELTRTKRYLKKKGSLMWFLNNTKTPMGARLLKKYISEPLMNLKEIKKRQNAISELVENIPLQKKLDKLLVDFCDISRACADMTNSTISPRDLYLMVNNAQKITDLRDVLCMFKSPLLKINKENAENVIYFIKTIKRAIKEDAPKDIKNGSIISDGYDPGLDYLKFKLKAVLDEIEKYRISQIKKTGIEKLKIGYMPTIGYYIEVTKSDSVRVPESYFKKQKLSNCVRYSTNYLSDLEEEFGSLKFKINELEFELYKQIREVAHVYSRVVRLVAADIAQIDCINSMAICAIQNNLVKPEFNSTEIIIKDGFHPSLIKLKNEVIKNDTELKLGSMLILTGANMSGKSTYLKHNAIICLLAQIGSFVPAKSANLTVVDKIFFRQGSTDDIINNNSSFMVEMNDLKFILDKATNSSFVFLDEPAKSTSSIEGGAIARAFLEYLIKHFKLKAIVATHNFELTKIEKFYPKRVSNCVMASFEDKSSRKISKGVLKSSCAINTAILANLPQEIIENSKKYLT